MLAPSLLADAAHGPDTLPGDAAGAGAAPGGGDSAAGDVQCSRPSSHRCAWIHREDQNHRQGAADGNASPVSMAPPALRGTWSSLVTLGNDQVKPV